MTSGSLKISSDLQYLQVLDEKGNLDKSLEPKISADVLQDVYRKMILARRFDERLLSLQRQGKIGTFGPIKGQEAAQLGAAVALKESDWVVPSYRETVVALWRGMPLENLILYYGGYSEGGLIPEDARDLPLSIPVGTQMLHAVGIGYGVKYRKEEDIVMTFFGDGATSEGDFHEAMNFASVFELPVVFVCQNNQWAISVPRERQTHSETIAQKAVAYGMDGIQVDGNDFLAVYSACRRAVETAREKSRPTLVECVTYRMEMHTTADDPTRYRDDEEVEKWAKRDPIDRLRQYLQSKEIFEDDDADEAEDNAKAEVQAAWERCEKKMKELDEQPEAIFAHILKDRPVYLERQREDFNAWVSASRETADG